MFLSFKSCFKEVVMNRKILYTLIAFLLCVFTFSFCFAADEHPIQDAANTVRNVVGGAENAIENGAKDVGNATKNSTNAVQNTMNHAGNTVKNSTSKAENTGNYTATRTSTNGSATFMGMNATVWTWLIIGIAAIAIVALVWYYSSQITNNHSDNRRV